MPFESHTDKTRGIDWKDLGNAVSKSEVAGLVTIKKRNAGGGR